MLTADIRCVCVCCVCVCVTHWGLKAAVEFSEVWMGASEGQHSLLCHGALHVIVLQDDILLQHLHCKHTLTAVQAGQHHLYKCVWTYINFSNGLV